MPITIPRYNAQVEPIAKSGNAMVEHPEFLTAGMKDVVGEPMMKAGKVLAEYENKKQTMQDAIDKARVMAEATKDHYETMTMAENDPTFTDSPDKLAKRQKTLNDKYHGMVNNEKLWALIQPSLQGHFGIENIKVSAINRKNEINRLKTNLYGIGDITSDMLITEDNPEIRAGYIKNFNDILEKSIGTIITPAEAEAMKKVTLVKSDFGRLKKVASADPAEAYQQLKERDKYFPSMSEGDEFVAYGIVDKMVDSKNRELAKELKDKQSKGAVEASARFRQWQVGKDPKFESWLDDEWANERLSDGTYRMFVDKVFVKKEGWSHKMSPAKWKVFNNIQKEILKDESIYSTEDDLAQDKGFNALPESKQNVLMGLIGKSIPIKNAIRVGLSDIRRAASFSGYLPDELSEKEQAYRDATVDVETPVEIRRITKEFINDMSGGKPSGAVKETEKGKEKVPVFNAKTGKFE